MPGLWPKSIRFQVIAIISVLLLVPIVVMAFDIIFFSKTDDVLVRDMETKLTRIVDRMSSQVELEVTTQLSLEPDIDISSALVKSFESHAEAVVDVNQGIRLGLYIVAKDEVHSVGFLHQVRPPGESPSLREQRVFRETQDGIKAVVASGTALSKLGQTWDDRFLEYLVPVKINSKLVAVVWAQERMHPAFAESAKARQVILVFTLVVFGFGVGATILSMVSWVGKVGNIKDGLVELEKDLNNTLPDLPGEMGQITRAINKMAASLSEKEQMAEQLRRSEYLTSLGRLVTDIAHELRSPVTIIQTTIDLMEPQVKGQSELREYVEMIQRQIDRHNKLTNELLNFGSPIRVDMETFDLRLLVKNVAKQAEQLFIKNNVELKIVESKRLPSVNGDQAKLTQAFMNLIVNAIQAMPKGGQLIIKTYVEDEWSCISFTDTGNGIKEEHMPNIFQPFFSKKAGGSGLGLAITKKIIESHGGTITVESEVGKGTKFTISLPDSFTLINSEEVPTESKT